MSRMLGDAEQVVGAGIGGSKIGGDVDDAFVVFPDPMGATGSSLSMAIETYKKKVPERRGRSRAAPDRHARVPAADAEGPPGRGDLRGAARPRTLAGEGDGHHARPVWDKERGLNEHEYIVPGGGGMGEVMNNAWV